MIWLFRLPFSFSNSEILELSSLSLILSSSERPLTSWSLPSYSLRRVTVVLSISLRYYYSILSFRAANSFWWSLLSPSNYLLYSLLAISNSLDILCSISWSLLMRSAC